MKPQTLFWEALQLLLVGLKLGGPLASWSWLLVLWPTELFAGLMFLVLALTVLHHYTMTPGERAAAKFREYAKRVVPKA